MVKAGLEFLPEQVQERIFSYLDARDLVVVAALNKSLRRVTTGTEILWKKLFFAQFKEVAPSLSISPSDVQPLGITWFKLVSQLCKIKLINLFLRVR